MVSRNIQTNYEVTITRKTSWEDDERKNMLVEKIPVGKKTDPNYGRSEEIYHEKYAVADVVVSKTSSEEVFTQQVSGDKFDLKRVILAINSIDNGVA